MSIITEKSVNAFRDGKNFKQSNSQIITRDGISKFYLFGNEIAVLNRNCGQLIIRDCGWQSKTTKERLNGILSVLNCGYIKQEHWTWYYVSRKGIQNRWNGYEEIDVNFN